RRDRLHPSGPRRERLAVAHRGRAGGRGRSLRRPRARDARAPRLGDRGRAVGAHALGRRHGREQRRRGDPRPPRHRRRRPWAGGAKVYVDAVHATPHRAIDAEALGCDALVCSAYKWFGPHTAILSIRPELFEELRPDKLRPSPDEIPDRFELGTLPFESLAGVRAAAEFMLSLDRDELRAHEDALLAQMLDGLNAVDDV